MKVLILSPVPPEPNSSAAGKRIMDFIEAFLDWNWTVDLATTGTESQFQVPLKTLSDLGITCSFIKPNDDGFDSWLKAINPDIVIFDRFYIEEQFGWRVEQVCPEALRVLETCDLHSLREVREQNHFLSDPTQLHCQMLQSHKGLRELASVFRCDLSLTISDFEFSLLINQFQIPKELVFYCPFWIKSQGPKRKTFEERENISWIGNFNHPPNWDSVRWLRNEIWPLIQKLNPQLKMSVYGAYPSEKVMQLHRPEIGFNVLGRAENSVQVLESSKVLLAPLRFGAGLKGKILDAALAGTPIVTTGIGAEGLGPATEFPGVIFDQPDDLAEACVQLSSERDLWLNSHSKAALFLKSLFDSERLKTDLRRALEAKLAQLKKDRLKNLTGALLRHHSNQSTKHLSNWIALKNQITKNQAQEL